ncbi:MAG: hypothetical protein ACRDRS_13910 [Pseudonocardiaceae bacterium]
MSAARWGISARDWHAHAIEDDESSERHPGAVWITRCGLELRRVATLYDEPPTRICPTCANPAEATP